MIMYTSRSIPLMLAIALCTGFITGCSDDPVQPDTCPGATYHMSGVFSQIPPPYEDKVTYDKATHEYRFRADVNGTICNIGYQNKLPTSEYTFKIMKVSDGAVLYEGVLQFSATTTQYINIPTVNILAGQDYIISRTENGYFTSVDKTGVGRTKWSPNALTNALILPISSGHISILQTYVDFNKGDDSSRLMPFIDFGFVPE